jgi:beta-N-acetylhexosaminidase
MSFSGVVITDDMTMGAIVKNYSIENAAIRAVKAGADIVLVSRGYADQIAVLNALANAAANGTIPMERINQSVYRILKLKRKYSLTDSRKGPVDIAKINNDIRAVLKLFTEG